MHASVRMAPMSCFKLSTVSISPPVVTASPWPASIAIEVVSTPTTSDPSCVSEPFIQDRASPPASLSGLWLLSVWHGPGKSESVVSPPKLVAPTSVQDTTSNEILLTFREEIEVAHAGVVDVMLCPAPSGVGDIMRCPAAASPLASFTTAPLMVASTGAAAAELLRLFSTMKRLVADEQHKQQQYHLAEQQLQQTAAGSDGHCEANVTAGMMESWLQEDQPAQKQEHQLLLPAAITAADAAAQADEASVTRSTWLLHFQPLLLDMQTILLCSVGSHSRRNSMNAAASSSRRGSYSTIAGAAGIAHGLAGMSASSPEMLAVAYDVQQHPVAGASSTPAAAATAATTDGKNSGASKVSEQQAAQEVGRLLGCVLEFFALHSSWCCISFLLAEAFKNGLLASAGQLAAQQLKQLHVLQQIGAPTHAAASIAAAATAAALAASLVDASATGAEEDCTDCFAASGSIGSSYAGGCLHAHSSSVGHCQLTAPSCQLACSSSSCDSSICSSNANCIAQGTAAPACFRVPAGGSNKSTWAAAVLLVIMMAALLPLLAATAAAQQHYSSVGPAVAGGAADAALLVQPAAVVPSTLLAMLGRLPGMAGGVVEGATGAGQLPWLLSALLPVVLLCMLAGRWCIVGVAACVQR